VAIFEITYYNIGVSDTGLSWFRQVGERYSMIQVESEFTLVNQRLKKKVNANNIVPFARKQALVAA
jgi:hypothetical protein